MRTSEHQVAFAQALSLSSSFGGSGGGVAGHSGSAMVVEVELLEVELVAPEVLGPVEEDGPVLDGAVVVGHGSVVVEPPVLEVGREVPVLDEPPVEVGIEVALLDGPPLEASPATSPLPDVPALLVGSELEVVVSGHGSARRPGSGLAKARPPASTQKASGTDSDDAILRRVLGISSHAVGLWLSMRDRADQS